MDVHYPMALSALGESANVITGNASKELAAKGYTCDIGPPVIIKNQPHNTCFRRGLTPNVCT
jgi:CheY-specific phosphatase CheX